MSLMKTGPEPSPYQFRLLRADWVCPMWHDAIKSGGLLLRNGYIAAVGLADDLLNIEPDADLTDLPGKVLLPGLVNAHCHLELSQSVRPPSPGGDFIGWLKTVMTRARIEPADLPANIEANVAEGVRQSLKFGVTSIGDISRHCDLTRPILSASPLRIVSYGEVLAMAQRRKLLEARLAVAAAPVARAENYWENLRVGISPHAPYSVEIGGYRRCREFARSQNLPLATHLAETPFEEPFLRDHSGPFRDFWEWLGAWDDNVPKFDGGPIRFARSVGLLDYPTLLAHVNYCNDEELAILKRGKASVVYCPRTHQYFQHPPHRWQEMLAEGINVAVGTDSCASSADLNLVNDLRLLHHIAPQVPCADLWQLATTRAARAIGQEETLGSLKRGLRADLIAFEIESEDPLRAILETPGALPTDVWINGKRQ